MLKAVIESHFKSYFLISVFRSGPMSSKINRFYERLLRIPYADFAPNFEELLEKRKVCNLP